MDHYTLFCCVVFPKKKNWEISFCQKRIYFSIFFFFSTDLWIGQRYCCFVIGIESRHWTIIGMGNRSMLYSRTSWSGCMLFGISFDIQCKVSNSLFIFFHLTKWQSIKKLFSSFNRITKFPTKISLCEMTFPYTIETKQKNKIFIYSQSENVIEGV